MSYESVNVKSVDLLNQERIINKEEISKMFIEFIHNFKGESESYYTQLHTNLTQDIYSLTITLDHINSYNPGLYTLLCKDPLGTIDIFETSIINQYRDTKYIDKMTIHLVSNGKCTKIREIKSVKANKIIKVEGIVISASTIITKPKELHIECRSCSEVKRVTDVIPRKCDNKQAKECPLDPFIVIPEKSKVEDVQYVKIQESFEDIPMGETPRAFSIQMSNDLCNSVSPGCKVVITGVFCIRSKGERSFNYLHSLGVESEKNKIKVSFSENEETVFRNLVKEGESIYERIAKSIAPSIYGKEDVKKALACMLFGGTRKEADDGIKLRGDINVLLLGDPGIAKSQFLKFVEQVSPISVYTSGKGSSAAGLTASVLRDKNNDFYLEGGALVLADNGVCCIDEFDKMNENDRVAIHEAMEQQTISIAKAGITTVLNTRTAILAAANPVFGRYDDYKTPAENIEFGTTILSRFDLIFILKDKYSTHDKETASHVLNLHLEENVKKQQSDEIISIDLLRNYIQYAKTKCNPILGEDAAAKLNRFYLNIRAQVSVFERGSHKRSCVPITVRQLEAIIRISESLAKMELNSIVNSSHVDEAIRLFQASTMNAVSQGHQIEGMYRSEFLSQIAQIVEKIKEILPIGSSKKFIDLVKTLDEEENVVRKAVQYMVKQNKIAMRENGKSVIRMP